MAIAKNPKRYTPDSEVSDRAAQQFIAGAGTTATVTEASQARKTPIMIRFDPALLKRVDSAAKRRGVSRSSWIQYEISKVLDKQEG
jgi:hypothetical protein